MESGQFFDAGFEALTRRRPLQWQRRLFADFVADRLKDALDIPTGLGKTSVIVIWLLALAWQAADGGPRLPRRLIYVVNRRTVVDQATDVVVGIRQNLLADEPSNIVREVTRKLGSLCARPEQPLAVSTLRGELADNREWQADPARPAIIIGTVDMIGSRLMFSGYGVSRRMRPFHAGLVGQDVLIVHDEAHLTPAFGALLWEIARIQRQGCEPRPLRVFDLSATQRVHTEASRFTLDDEDRAEEEVSRRLNASKTLRFEEALDDSFDPVAASATCALAHDEAIKRILVYVRSPKMASAVAAAIAKRAGRDRVALLTGTVRGHERNEMTSKALDRIEDGAARRRAAVFRGFRADPVRQPPEQTEYLVATSAGEVGVDLDADHLVCDLATLDSMIQRIGRVNRLGRGSALIQVVEVPEKQRKEEDNSETAERLTATKEALQSLPPRDGGYDASPGALQALAGRSEAFSKEPRRAPLTDILLDGWSMTRFADLPGRPPVERWLHGVEGSAPALYVAWRDEVHEIAGADRKVLKTLFDKHPILSHERLRGTLNEVADELQKIAKRDADVQAILLPADGDPEAAALAALLGDQARLHEATIVIPGSAGGLDERGMLDGSVTTYVRDVADVPLQDRDAERGEPVRMRVLLTRDLETGIWSARPLGSADRGMLVEAGNLRSAARAILDHFPNMVPKDVIVLHDDDDGEPSKGLLILAKRRSIETAQDSPAAAANWQLLEEHSQWARDEAELVSKRLLLASTSPEVANAIVIAADCHDRGKDRPGWQKAIGNPPLGGKEQEAWKPWAKSGRRGFDESACGRYRHEFGSLREAAADPAIRSHPERDLILHAIAAHHGWARPHFEPEQWDIADDVTEEENAEVAAAAMRRFARLQRRFGRWGLAWIEALVRSADYAATERLSSGLTKSNGGTA